MDILLLIIGIFLAFLMTMAFLPGVTLTVSRMVKDKEDKQKEGMAMMGLSASS